MKVASVRVISSVSAAGVAGEERRKKGERRHRQLALFFVKISTSSFTTASVLPPLSAVVRVQDIPTVVSGDPKGHTHRILFI